MGEGIAARVPSTPASMVASVSGVGLDAFVVDFSPGVGLSGATVPCTGTQAVKNRLISSENPIVLAETICNTFSVTRHPLI